MRRQALLGLAVAAWAGVLATQASACGFCDCRPAGYYGSAGYGYFAPRAYAYSYYQPRDYGYFYEPRSYGAYAGGFYGPQAWGWRGSGYSGWRRW